LSKLQIKGSKLVKTDRNGDIVNISYFRPKAISKAKREMWKNL